MACSGVLSVLLCYDCPSLSAGAPQAGGSSTAAAVTQPIPVTEADMKKYSNKGYIFRGVAAPDVAGTW